MGFWEGFSRYCGIQGILAIALIGGYIAAPYAVVELPNGYTEMLTLVVGFFFAKNGGNYVAKIKGSA